MSLLKQAMDSLGFQYFCSADEYLLIFRGEVLDHYVLVRQGESFVHATCVLSRAPTPLDPQFAYRLLQWNAQHSLSRMAIGNGELLLLAELPLQGLQPRGVEELILSVASAAEEFSSELLPFLLRGPEPVGATTGGTTHPENQDPEIDWETT